MGTGTKILGLLLFQHGIFLYTHIEYYCENGTDASEKIKITSDQHRLIAVPCMSLRVLFIMGWAISL